MDDDLTAMRLTVNVPDRVVIEANDVLRIVAESLNGSFGIYPHRLDCIAPLVPGILVFEQADVGEQYLAVDEGILTKMGLHVIVSVRSAVVGHDLREMQMLVEQEFLQLSEQEQNVRMVLARIEDDFVRLYREVQNE